MKPEEIIKKMAEAEEALEKKRIAVENDIQAKLDAFKKKRDKQGAEINELVEKKKEAQREDDAIAKSIPERYKAIEVKLNQLIEENNERSRELSFNERIVKKEKVEVAGLFAAKEKELDDAIISNQNKFAQLEDKQKLCNEAITRANEKFLEWEQSKEETDRNSRVVREKYQEVTGKLRDIASTKTKMLEKINSIDVEIEKCIRKAKNVDSKEVSLKIRESSLKDEIYRKNDLLWEIKRENEKKNKAIAEIAQISAKNKVQVKYLAEENDRLANLKDQLGVIEQSLKFKDRDLDTRMSNVRKLEKELANRGE